MIIQKIKSLVTNFIIIFQFNKNQNMKLTIQIICFFIAIFSIVAQNDIPSDYLTSEFHKSRREALRADMPKNTVAVFFANAVRNRANDVEYVYHQDPNFYYLTGYKEPNAVLVIFSDKQIHEIKFFFSDCEINA